MHSFRSYLGRLGGILAFLLIAVGLPAQVVIQHDALQDTNETATPYRVCATITSETPLQTNGVDLFYTTDNQTPYTYSRVTMMLDEEQYCGNIPPQPFGKTVRYYIRARNTSNVTALSPPNAPTGNHTFIVGFPQFTVTANANFDRREYPDNIVLLKNAITIENVGFGTINWSARARRINGAVIRWVYPVSNSGMLNTGQSISLDVYFDTQELTQQYSDSGNIIFTDPAIDQDEILLPIGLFVTPQPKNRLAYNYNLGQDSWLFLTAPLFFTEAEGGWNGTALYLKTLEGHNHFAMWASEPIEIYSPGQPVPTEFDSLEGTIGPTGLLRVDYHVRTNGNTKLTLPQFRVRFNSEDFQESMTVAHESVGSARNMPGSQTRIYPLYVTIGQNLRQFRVFFDLLNFGNRDDIGTSYFVELVSLETMLVSQLKTPRLEYLSNFQGGTTDGFVTLSIPDVFDAPEVFSSSTTGLQIQGALEPIPNPPTLLYGWWERTFENVFTIQPGRLYTVKFTVATNATEQNHADTPSFRMRVNSTDFQIAAFMEAHSFGDLSFIPQPGGLFEYQIHIEGNEHLAGASLLAAFEYFFLATFGGDTTMQLELRRLEIISRPL